MCKILRKRNLLNYSKNERCNVYVNKEEIYQYVFKKYYTIYIGRKKKYRDCENSSLKCITNSNYYYYYYLELLRLIYLF